MSNLTEAIRGPSVKAFCSYVHKDNESFSHTVESLVQDFRSLHEAETGRDLEIFFDREDIGWGQDLRNAVSQSVENATFLLPIITARYFQSPWCRDELLSFHGKCQALGVTELILPVVLAAKSQIVEESEDEVVRIIAQIRYIDWTEVWQHGRGSAAWNIGLTELVRRLVALREPLEARLAARALQFSFPESMISEVDNARGSNTASLRVSEWLERLNSTNTSVLDSAVGVVADFKKFLDDLAAGFSQIEITDQAAMISALDRLAAKFSARGHHLQRTSRFALERMVEFDEELRGIIRATGPLGGSEQNKRLAVEADSLRTSAVSLSERIREVNSASVVLRQYGDVSVGLRVALSPARAGLQSLLDMGRIVDGWVSLEV